MIMGLEIEVHSICVLWTNNLQDYKGVFVCLLKGHDGQLFFWLGS